MKTRESSIEKKVCDYARSKKMLVYKFTSPGKRAVPDRQFISPSGRVAFVEFKALGKRPTELQSREIATLRAYNVAATWADSVEAGKEFLDSFLAAEESPLPT